MAIPSARGSRISASQAALTRAVLLALATGLLTTCSESPISPSGPGPGILRLAPVFPAGARVVGLPLDNVRLVVVRPPGSTILDKSYSFPASQTRLAISEVILLQDQSELLEVTLTCLSGVTPLFRGSSVIEVRQGPATGPGLELPVTFVGPGDDVTTISISPRDTVLTFDATLAFQVTARDAQGQNVAQFYVSWLSTDPGQLPDGDGVLHAGTTRTALQITATTHSGARDSTTVRVVPPPARLLVTAGDDQSAPVGTRLSQPLEVEVRGSDDLPIPGVTVSFTPPSGGTVDTPRAVTDASGRARTGATLGPGSGAQSFTASATGAGSVSFTATATAPALPTVSFTTASQTMSEGVGTATITAQLSSTTTQTVTVPFNLTGTATSPADFTASVSPLTITAGNTTATITVSLAADGLAEPDETVIATLTTPTNATLGPTPVHTLTIAGQVPTVSFTAASQTAGEGVGTATITAQLSSPSTVPVTVPFTLSGTATQAVDYTATGSPLTITPGNTTATITFTLVADGVAEPDETVIATLDPPTNATLGPTTVHTLTITGQVPTVSFTQATQSVPEGVVATITADLSSSSTQTVTVPFALTGTATDPADYSATTGALVIAPGSTRTTITVTIVADGVAEPDETVIATLGSPSNATLGPITVHTLIIAGQTPTLSFTAATQTVNEGVVATITAELSSAATQPVTVPFALTGTATAPADYTVTTGPLVIAAGSTTATISVTVVADGVAEPDETVIATLGPPTNATLGATTVYTLTIAGQVPTVSFTAASQTVNEGAVATITAQLSGASTQAVTVPFILTGTASNAADYTATASPLTIAAGNTTATITVTVTTDGVAEPDETVTATLGSPTNAVLGAIAVHTLTINGQIPTVSFTTASQSVGEGAGSATITAQLSSPSTQTVTIPFTLAGTAGNPADYTASATPLTIAPGNTTAAIALTIVPDAVAEPDETVIATLSAPTNATLGAITAHTLTITGQLPTLSFTAATQSVNEGVGTATITAQLSTTSTQTVTVPFTLTGTASNGVDYTATASPLTIAAGNTTATIIVTVATDGVDEPDETVIATLTAPTNAVLGATTAHTLTILGQTPTVSFTAATQTVNEGVVATITAQLSSPSTQQVTIPFTATGTATNPADYSITASPLVIAPGNTTAAINVTIAADGVAEPIETVVVTLGTPINASVGAITVHTLTIAPQLPTVSFTAATQTVNEGAVATITAQLSGPSTQTVTVPFNLTGTASNGVDYTATASPLTIAAGSTTATISVTVATDGVAEPDETVVATLSTPTNAALGAITVHTLTIPGQTPTVSFTAAAQMVNEGVVATITAQLSGPSTQTVSVPFNLTGTATNGADYTATASPLTIAAGNITATISVTVAADGVAEPSETVVASLGTPINAALGAVTVHTLTIAPQVPTVSFTQATQLVNEGVVATITAQLSSPSSQAVSVPYSVTGTATNPADYTITANPLVIAPGNSSGTISVTVLSDGVAEPNETVVVTMGTPANAIPGAITVHTVNIAPQTPTVSFTVATQTVSEAVGTATITAQLSSPSTQAVSVPYSVTGTATNGVDYTIPVGPLTIAAGSTAATINVSVAADGVAEPNETVVVTMGTPINAALGAITAHTLNIAPQTPTVSFTVGAQTVNEGVVATITAQLSGPSTLGVSVPFSLTGTATNTVDYTASATPLVIAAGSTSNTISVTVVSDGVAEPNETVVVTMGTPTNANLGAITVHTVNIAPQTPTVSFTQATQTVNEGTVATITAQLSGPSTQAVSVPFSLTGTATNGADYTATASPLTIAAGNTAAAISVNVVADQTIEPNESVVATMGTPTNAILGAITVHTLTIASQQPTVRFTLSNQSLSETVSQASITAQLSGTSTQTVTVPFTLGGTATNNVDYRVSPSPLTFAPGATLSGLTLSLVNDTLGEPNETVLLILGTPTNAILGNPSIDTVTIVDNDAHPPVLSSIRYVQFGATNTCDIFGGPLGTAFRVTFAYTDAGGDVIKPGAKDSVAYQFRPQGASSGFDDTGFSTFTGTGFSGTIVADMCFLFGPATTTSVDVSMFVTDIAGTRSAPITVNILRPLNANSTGESQPLGARSAALPVGGGPR